MMQHAERIIVYLALIVACVMLWSSFTPSPAPVSQWQPAKVAPVVDAVPTVQIEIPKVTVFSAPAKAKLKLPDAIVQNPDAHVIAATQVKPDLHPQTVVTVINSATGESETITRRDPYPWAAATQSGELRLDYGYKFDHFASGGKMIAKLTLREDLLQLKALHIGATASLESDGTMFAGVGLGYRW